MAFYAYSNNGLSYRTVEPGWALAPGEVSFAEPPNAAQLAAAFPGYGAAAAVQAAQTTYAEKIAAGLAITSTGTPAVDATYALDAAQQSNVANVALYIAVNGRFPGGLASLSLRKVDGTTIQIPTTALSQAISTAIADYIAQLDAQLVLALGGGTPAWPAANVTIA